MAKVGDEEAMVTPTPERSWRDFGIRSRLSFALSQEGFSKDVTFIVGSGSTIQTISAHRLILSLSSSYLDKLLRDGSGGLIKLPETCPKMFSRLLKFIYTDEIEMENVLAFLDFAKTFGFHYLHETCLESWTRTDGIRVENVVNILGLVRRLNTGDNDNALYLGLREDCIQFINSNACHVVGHNSFNEISQQDLAIVLESDDFILEGGEFSIFLLALSWAKYQCKIGGLGENYENLRLVLGEARMKIRFTLIPTPKLHEVKSAGLLTAPEFYQVGKTAFYPTDNPLGISTKPRNNYVNNFLIGNFCGNGFENVGTAPPPPVPPPPPELLNMLQRHDNFEPLQKRRRTLTELSIETTVSPSPPPSPPVLVDPIYAQLSPPQFSDVSDAEPLDDTIYEPGCSLGADSLTRAPNIQNSEPIVVTPPPRFEKLIFQGGFLLDSPASIEQEKNIRAAMMMDYQHDYLISTRDFEPAETHEITPPRGPHTPESAPYEVVPRNNNRDPSADFDLETDYNRHYFPTPLPPPQQPQVYSPILADTTTTTNEHFPSSFSPLSSMHSQRTSASTEINSNFNGSLSVVSSADTNTTPMDFLVVSNTTVNWPQLILAAKQDRFTLTRILLKNAALTNFKREKGGRVVLHRLISFHYSLDQDSRDAQNSSSFNPTLPDKSHPYFTDMKAFLFFEKESGSRWDFSELPRLGVDIRISIKGIHLMTISPQKVVFSYLPRHERNAILENCPSDTKIFSVCCTKIKSPEKIPTAYLEQLTLYNVEMHGMTATRLINQCQNLRHVALYESPTSPEKVSQIFLITDFKLCRSKLKSLCLSKYNISGPSEKCLPKFTPFDSLESLYLNGCSWNPHFTENFSYCFPNLKRFGIRWTWKDKAQTCALLKNVLGLNTLKFLSISLSPENDVVGDEVNEFFNLDPADEEIWMQNFLVEATQLELDTAQGGYVEEDLLGQNIVLNKVDRVWKRSGNGGGEEGEGEGDDAATDRIHFLALKLHHFFDDEGMVKFLL